MAERADQEVMSSRRGALAWGPAAAFSRGVLAVVDSASNSGRCETFLVELDGSGRLRAQSDPLPLEHPYPGGAIAVAEAPEALVVALDRKEHRFELRSGLSTVFYYDQPRWFKCVGKKGVLKVNEIGFWEGVCAHGMTATLRDGQAFWTMSSTRHMTEPVTSGSVLAYAFGASSDVPVMKETDVSCSDITHLVTRNGQHLALTVSAYKEMQLWRLHADRDREAVASLSARGQRSGEVSGSVVYELADGFVFLWRYFNRKARRETRDGGLWFRTCDPGLTCFATACRLSDDREITAGSWQSFPLIDSILIVWKNGVSRKSQQTRYVRIRNCKELPNMTQDFPGNLPAHVIQTRSGVVTLSTVFSARPYHWSLRTQLLDPAAI
jgi:hypothetical protein